jgi:hypothetical protein
MTTVCKKRSCGNGGFCRFYMAQLQKGSVRATISCGGSIIGGNSQSCFLS